MGSGCQHPRLQALREQPLNAQCETFVELEGDLIALADDPALVDLRSYLMRLRLAPCAERRVEGEHAKVQNELRKAPNHSDSYISLARRFKSFREELELDVGVLNDLAGHFRKVLTAQDAVEALGLQLHPSCQDAAVGDRRDKVYWKVIYHADSWTKFIMAAPSIELHGPGGPGGADGGRGPGGGGDGGDGGADVEHWEEDGEEEGEEDGDEGDDGTGGAGGGGGGGKSSAPKKEDVHTDEDVTAFREHWARIHLHFKMTTTGRYYSMPLHPNTFQTLRSTLVPSLASRSSGLPLGLGIGNAPATGTFASNQVFWKTVGFSPARAIRTRVEGEESLSSKTAVSAHSLLSVSLGSKAVTVGIAPSTLTGPVGIDAPLTFSGEALTLKQLSEVREWSQKGEEVQHHFLHTYALDADQARIASKLLPPLSCGGLVLHGDASEEERALIHKLRDDEMVSGPPWLLTDKGRSYTELGVQIDRQVTALRAPTGVDEKTTHYELMLLLDADGWSQVALHPHEVPDIKAKPFQPGEGKVWFTRRGKVGMSRNYLLALLWHERHGKAVPHFEKDTLYRTILAKSPFRASARRKEQVCDSKFFIAETEEAEEEHRKQMEAAHTRTKPQVRARKAMAKAPVILDAATAKDDSEAKEKGDVGEDSEVGEDGEVGDDGEDSGGGSGGGDSSSSSNSSSSSSSSSRSSSKEKPPEPEGKTRSSEHTEYWGLHRHRLTPRWSDASRSEVLGFQMTCNHPHHSVNGDCNKTKTCRIHGGEQMCRRMLKYWVILGLPKHNKKEHKELWKVVETAAADGTVPEEEELDKQSALAAEAKATSSAKASSSDSAKGRGSAGGALPAKKARHRR